jgi:alpha-glucosidase
MSLAANPHHDGSAAYLANEAPGLGERVSVRLRVPASFGATDVHVRSVADGEPHYAMASVVETEPGEGGAVWWEGEVRAVNPVTPYRFLVETPSGPRWVNGRGTSAIDVADRDDFVLSTHEPPPAWLADAVAYQVFPDRFARSRASLDAPDVPVDGDWPIESDWDDPIDPDWKQSVRQLYRGDLAGVRERLDHLERLGVNLVYLTPVFPARSSHRYDASTFDEVDPVLGGDAALAALTDAAHARGIRVIGDLTTNHSGDHHRWFQAAQADASSPEASYYTFRHHPHDYVAWFDVPSLPKFDLRSPALRDRLVRGADSIAGRWLRGPSGPDDRRRRDAGLDGWRIDVANMTGRLGEVDVNHDVFRDVRETMRQVKPDAWLVAEHCYDATTDLTGDGWHGVMAYSWFTRPVWSWLARPDARLMGVPGPLPRIGGDGLAASQQALTAGVPWRSVAASMTLLDSHDTSRFASVAVSPAHQLVGIGLLLTSVGVPMVFAGDEVGVTGADSNLARAPFPWDESRWDRGLLDAYRDLIAVRRSSDALRRGGLRFVAAGPDSLAFVRETADEQVLVLASRAAHEPLRVRAAEIGPHRRAERLYGDGDVRFDASTGAVELPGAGPSFAIWRLG